MNAKLTKRQMRLLQMVKKAQSKPVYAWITNDEHVFVEWDSYTTYAFSIETAIAKRLAERGYLKKASAWPVFNTRESCSQPGRRPRRIHLHAAWGGKWWLTEKGMRAVQTSAK